MRYKRFISPPGAGLGRLKNGRDGGPHQGQVILITGAGGFIGSALAKAIAASGPARIILLDSSESNLFGIHRYFEASGAHVPHEAILGSVTDAPLLNDVLGRFRPSIVYHTAALKHVPLLEHNPMAAVQNNAVGTYRLAQAALAHGTAALVLVSTDKAVNPHSVMGASKRLAELVVATLGGSPCRMNAVRLGNVIGSTGSVVPIFLDQIARRVPVTITDPEVSRYFMTLEESVDAILAGGAANCRGRILLPELGEPERIADVARFLIESAASAGDDIPIRVVGLRPGEKLREELIFESEVREGSAEGGLTVIRTPSPAPDELNNGMAQLEGRLASRDVAGMIETIRAMIPEYQPSAVIGSMAE